MLETTRPARKPASQYHHGDLRRALLQEAVRTITEDGVDALTLREAGRRLGVSRTALYRHFSDKSTLLAAVARDGFQRFRDDLLRAWSEAAGTRRGFELMGVAYVRFAVANPAHYRVMFGDYRHLCDKDPELKADAEAAFRVLVEALSSMQQAKLARADDPVLQAEFVWAVVHGLAMFAIDGQFGRESSTSGELAGLIRYALQCMRTGIGVDTTGAAR